MRGRACGRAGFLSIALRLLQGYASDAFWPKILIGYAAGRDQQLITPPNAYVPSCALVETLGVHEQKGVDDGLSSIVLMGGGCAGASLCHEMLVDCGNKENEPC